MINEEKIKISTSEKGGEFTSILFQGIERIVNSQRWEYHTPILFPLVSQTKNNQITIQGHTYDMPRHGFLRDNTFCKLLHKQNHIKYMWQSYGDILNSYYPYPCSVEIDYIISDQTVNVTYRVTNTGPNTMYFCIGAHPGFSLLPGTQLSDYTLVFGQEESDDAIISTDITKPLIDGNMLHLRDLKPEQAVFLGNPNSRVVSILYQQKPFLDFSFGDTTEYFGLWHRLDPKHPFICLEPWSSMPLKNYSGEWSERPDIITLKSGKMYHFTYDFTFY